MYFEWIYKKLILRNYREKFTYEDLICNEYTKNETCGNNKTILCTCIHTLEVNLDDVVEIIVFDEAYTFKTNHNIHLHGFSFAVLGMDKVCIQNIKKLKNSKTFFFN